MRTPLHQNRVVIATLTVTAITSTAALTAIIPVAWANTGIALMLFQLTLYFIYQRIDNHALPKVS